MYEAKNKRDKGKYSLSLIVRLFIARKNTLFKKILNYSTKNGEGYEEYNSNPSDCKNCKLLNQYTKSKTNQEVVTRHIWEHYKEEVYKKRKEIIERFFAYAKKHHMRYTKLKGLQKTKWK